MSAEARFWAAVAVIIAVIGLAVAVRQMDRARSPVIVVGGTQSGPAPSTPLVTGDGDAATPPIGAEAEAPERKRPPQPKFQKVVEPVGFDAKVAAGRWDYNSAALSMAGRVYQGSACLSGSPGEFVTLDARGMEQFDAVFGIDDALPPHSAEVALEVDGQRLRTLSLRTGRPGERVLVELSGRTGLTFRCLSVAFDDGRQAWQSSHGAIAIAEPSVTIRRAY